MFYRNTTQAAMQLPIFAECRRRFNGGQDIDSILAYLREQEYYVIDSIKVTVALTGMSLAEAKSLVHNSAAWEDMRECHETLHDQLFDAFEQIQLEQNAED